MSDNIALFLLGAAFVVLVGVVAFEYRKELKELSYCVQLLDPNIKAVPVN